MKLTFAGLIGLAGLVACRGAVAPLPQPLLPLPSPPAPPAAPPPFASVHLTLGLPTGGHDTLLDEKYFVVSYDRGIKAARWVAWRLAKSDLGSATRSQKFHADPLLPAPVTDDDYVRSGYDRGHLCPSADRTSSPGANLATFVLSNVHPQRHELNAGPWEDLEMHERELAKAGRTLYIVAGGLFDAEPKTIGRGVAVPRASFKMIIALRDGEEASAVQASTPSIAVVIPNEAAVKGHSYQSYSTSIRAIEEATGYDFHTRVARGMQDAIEARTSPSL